MNNPFENLSKNQIKKLFDLLGTHTYKFKKNQEILPTIKHENIIGIVLNGYAHIIFIEYNGNEIISEKLSQNDIFGSNISFSNRDNCQIIAKQDTEVLVIDYKKLMNPKNLKYNYFNVFFHNIFDTINFKLIEKNERISILEKKQIREKLLEYFNIEYKKNYSKNIYLPFLLKDLADYIAVNRSAMFRELKNMKEEKVIEIKKRKITLLYK
jgi:CRP-like cAMP-binding protein